MQRFTSAYQPSFADSVWVGLFICFFTIYPARAQGQTHSQTQALSPPQTQPLSQHSSQSPHEIIPDQLLLQLLPGYSPEQLLRELRSNIENTGEILLVPIAPRLGIYRLDLAEEGRESIWLQRLRAVEGISAAQYNRRLQRRALPSDPLFPLQWSLNSGSIGGVADIGAEQAWDIATGGVTALGDSIVIAVIDYGFDLNHEDLWFWTNRGEIAGDGIDNDGNGYIDDVQGWNAIDNNPIIPVDLHGTHVSGIIAARANNGIGISGLNWNTPILPISIELEEDDVLAAYGYVHAMRSLYESSGGALGAFIVATNSSFGLDFAQPDDFPLWCAMYDSLGKLGILQPAATINAQVNIDVLGDVPTACPSDFMIGVTNTDNEDLLRAGYGSANIDLGSPGTGIYSSTPGNSYGYSTGTSMATPHVTGAIALLYAAACEALILEYREEPAEVALRLKNYLLLGVDSIPSLSGRTRSEGRLNVFRSMELMLDEECRLSAQQNLPVSAGWRLYPNPAKTVFYVEGPLDVLAGEAIATHWTLHDAMGRVRASEVLTPMQQPILSIPVQHLEPGLYHFRLGRVYSSPLLIMP